MTRLRMAAAAFAAALRGAPARCLCGDPCGRCGGCDWCCACPPDHTCSPVCIHAAMAIEAAEGIVTAAFGTRP